jgi:phage-related protein
MGAGTVTIPIVGDVTKLRKALGDADSELGGFTSKVDGVGQKLGQFGKTMTVGVTLPIIAGLGLATKAAVEDEAAQARLKKTLENTVGASDGVVASVEKSIEAMTKQSTFADDQLRPAFENLVRETRSVDEATKLMGTAMDLAAAKGISVEEASGLLVKAHNGQVRGLVALGIETKNAEGKTASFGDIMRDVNVVVGGQAAAALDTAGGQAAQMKVRMGELTEKIGGALLPILDKLIPVVDSVIGFFEKLGPVGQTVALVIVGLAAVIGPLIGLVTSLSVAFTFLAANPIVLIVAGIALLVAGLVVAYKNVGWFRDIVDTVFNWIKNNWPLLLGIITGPIGLAVLAISKNWDTIKGFFTGFMDFLRGTWSGITDAISAPFRLAFDAIKRLWNSTIGGYRFEVPSWIPFAGGKGFSIPYMHSGGIVPGVPGSDVLAMLQAGERVVPRGAAASGGGGTTIIQLVLDGKTVTEVVFNGLLEKQRRSGALGLT